MESKEEKEAHVLHLKQGKDVADDVHYEYLKRINTWLNDGEKAIKRLYPYKNKRVCINITDPTAKTKLGDPKFNGEYLMFSIICKSVGGDLIRHTAYNLYIDGKLQ